MPPRYSYWTIIIEQQPTAFRAAREEDLLPTFNRLKQKHPSAVMMWFQRGRLWASRSEAQAALIAERRGSRRPSPSTRTRDRGRAGEAEPGAGAAPSRDRTWRPGGDHRDPRQRYLDSKKAKWTRFKQRVRRHADRRRKNGG
jgi:hypothetical protein